MRTLLVTTHFLPLRAGAPRVYDWLATAFDGDMAVLTARRDYLTGNTIVADGDAFDASAAYPISRVDRMTTTLGTHGSIVQSLSRGVTILSAIRSLVKSHRPDAFIIGSAHRLGWLVPVLKLLFKKPVYLYLHGEEVQTQLKAGLDRRFRYGLKADGCFVVSQFTKILAGRLGFLDDQICLVCNAVDPDFVNLAPGGRCWRTDLGVNDNTPLVVSVGRFVDRKGFDRLLDAWQRIEGSDFHGEKPVLVLAGGGDGKDMLARKVADLSLTTVHIFDQITDQDLASLFDAADLFVLANRELENGDTEGFGLVFLEAGLFGVPSVGGRAGGVPDAVIDGETGVLVDAADPDKLAKAIAGLLSDTEKRRALGDKAKAHAEAQRWADRAATIRAFIAKSAHS